MGSEPEVCGTHLGFNSLTSTVFNSASGYEIGGSYGSKGDCMISQGTGSAWGPCPGGAALPASSPEPAVRAPVVLSGANDASQASSTVPTSQVSWIPAATCSGGVASRADLSTYANHVPKLGCYAPDASTAAYMAFEAQPVEPQYVSATFAAPPNWTGSDLALVFAGTMLTGNVTWTVQAGCSNADDVFSKVTFSEGTDVLATVSSMPSGVVRTTALTNFVSPAINNCAAGSLVTYRISRSNNDTLLGDAHLLGVVLTSRKSQ
jgi:hypothetical protein